MAVSPASMIASTRSATALAASLTSARVGRSSVRIDSSTWVATITGMPSARASLVACFWMPRHALEWKLEAKIAARHHDGVARTKDVGKVGHGLWPFELGNQRKIRGSLGAKDVAGLLKVRDTLHERQRDEVDASGHAKPQVVDVLLRETS